MIRARWDEDDTSGEPFLTAGYELARADNGELRWQVRRRTFGGGDAGVMEKLAAIGLPDRDLMWTAPFEDIEVTEKLDWSGHAPEPDEVRSLIQGFARSRSGARHVCDDACICPVHRTPLIYWPAGDDHACQDITCRYGHGGALREWSGQ